MRNVYRCSVPFKSYASGELVKHEEQDKAGMGYTLLYRLAKK